VIAATPHLPSWGNSDIQVTPSRRDQIGDLIQEALMNPTTRVTRQPEKPGPLQLAIIGWQRQLIAKREARNGEAVIDAAEPERAAATA
jgi:hypothetical protein